MSKINRINEQLGYINELLTGNLKLSDAEEGKVTKDAITPLRRGKLIPRNDSGGASRILHKCDYEDIDNVDLFIYRSKVSPSERNSGLDNFNSQEGFRTTGKGRGSHLVRCPEHNEPIPSGLSKYKCGCSYVYSRNEEYEPQSEKKSTSHTQAHIFDFSTHKIILSARTL